MAMNSKPPSVQGGGVNEPLSECSLWYTFLVTSQTNYFCMSLSLIFAQRERLTSRMTEHSCS